MSDLTDALVRLLSTHAIPLAGVADVAECRIRFPDLPWRVPDKWPRALVLLHPLASGVLETIAGGPNPVYFHHYRQVNHWLDVTALAAARTLEAAGFSALPIAASQTLDADDRVAHVSHRHLGLVAGLGWRGHNNLLVNRSFGCRFRLVSVLTDAPLACGKAMVNACESADVGAPACHAVAPVSGTEPSPVCWRRREAEPSDEPFVLRSCGSCTRCRDACPAGAIGGSPEAFDLEKCWAKLSEFRRIPRVGQRICGVCQSVCPPGRKKSV